jgi:predicted PurR-regulated permease PerM
MDINANTFLARFGMPHLNLSEYAKLHSTDIARTIQEPISHAFGKIAFTGLSLVIALLTMFFMLRDGERLRGPANELLPLPPERTAAILKKVGETVYAVFIGTVLVAFIQATLLAIGFRIAGLTNAFLFGIIALFLCTIPLIGATIIYVPAALILAASGHYWGAIGVVILGLVVTKLDYFLRPLLIGGRSSLHPIGIFFGILGGVLVFGPVGLVAGPMVLAVLLALQDVVREKVRGTADETTINASSA